MSEPRRIAVLLRCRQFPAPEPTREEILVNAGLLFEREVGTLCICSALARTPAEFDAALVSTGNRIVARKSKVAERHRNEERIGRQVQSDAAVFAGGSERGSPTIDSASAREPAELAMRRAPSRCQRVISARACGSTPVRKVMSTISLRSPSADEAVRQSWVSRHAPSRFRSPANSNRKAVGPSCM